MSTLSDRLTHALNELNVSQAELARRIGLKRQAIQYLCTSNVNKSKLSYDIADALDISVEWLATGKGEMRYGDSIESQLFAENKIVPILGLNQLSEWSNQSLDKKHLKEWTTTHGEPSENAYAIRLSDRSMYPRFDTETIVILDPSAKHEPPCFVLVKIAKTEDIVFRQLTKNDGKTVLTAYNDTLYRQIILSEDDSILGYMIEAKWLVT